MKINIKFDAYDRIALFSLTRHEVHLSLGQYEISAATKADILLVSFRSSFDYGLQKSDGMKSSVYF